MCSTGPRSATVLAHGNGRSISAPNGLPDGSHRVAPAPPPPGNFPCFRLSVCLPPAVLTSWRHQRVDAAKARIESLNPLVAVETHSDAAVLENAALEQLLAGVDMVCATEMDRDSLVRTPSFAREVAAAALT